MHKTTPRAAGFYQPAEWEKHEAVWLAWPSHGELWQEDLRAAQNEFIGFCEAIADVDAKTGKARGEKLNILVPTLEAGGQAELELKHLPHQIYLIPFGDIWLRDTAPIFLRNENEIASASFRFNGWGGKYSLPFDDEVSGRIAKEAGKRQFILPWVLEGGSVEVDGEGTLLTSKQCLLNRNRNPGMARAAIEMELCDTLGVKKILWLGDGLLNDHTDGHIDTIARLVAPGRALCMKAYGKGDPNKEIMQRIGFDLFRMLDAKDRVMNVTYIPSPGRVLNEDGDLMPASYLNFYIGNSTVVVPTYGSIFDNEAVQAVAEWFPNRRTVGLPAKSILTGGGAFHCISQQQPALEKK
jgi:agmatine deiminase